MTGSRSRWLAVKAFQGGLVVSTPVGLVLFIAIAAGRGSASRAAFVTLGTFVSAVIVYPLTLIAVKAKPKSR